MKSKISQSKLRTEIETDKTYQVTSSLFNSVNEATVAKQKMHQAGITDTAFLSSENKKRLSLGVFSSKETAAKRMDILQKKGFNAEINERLKEVKRYWADISYLKTSSDSISKRIPGKYQKSCE